MIIGCGKGASTPEPQAIEAGADATPVDTLSIVEGIQFRNVTIFPVVSTTPRDEDRLITLDEGILAQTVKVVEVGSNTLDDQDGANGALPRDDRASTNTGRPDQLAGAAHQQSAGGDRLNAVTDPFGGDDPGALLNDGADVNRVMVLNRSERPLYLMPGETIVGGQQDRTLAEETIIPPGDKPVEVDVYCVEHGRWAGRSPAQTALLAARLAPSNDATPVADLATPLANAVGPNGFLPGAGSLNKQSRLAVQQAKDQGAVWDMVAKVNLNTSVDAPTGGFTQLRRPQVARRFRSVS